MKAKLISSLLLALAPSLVIAADVTCGESPSKLFRDEETLNLVVRGDLPGSRPWGGAPAQATDAEIRVIGDDQNEKIIPVGLTSRGKSRAMVCSFKPLRIEWKEKKDRASTAFDEVAGANLKLVVHCNYSSGTIAENEGANQAVIREYAVYKMLEALGLPTFKTRLAKINYQMPDGTARVEGLGVFVEPNSAYGKRCGLKHVSSEQKGDIWKKVPALENLDPRLMASFLITRLVTDAADYIVDIGHNVEAFVDTDGKTQRIVSYDYNDSSLVKGRDIPFAFGSLESFYQKLRKGPFTRDGYNTELTADEKMAWDNAIVEISRSVVSKIDAAKAALDRLPLKDDERAAFKKHLDEQALQLQKIVVEGENPAP